MKKTIIFLSSVSLAFVMVKCSPAAEDRVKMHEKAKRVSDSIAQTIDAALEEVKIQPKNPAEAVADTTKK